MQNLYQHLADAVLALHFAVVLFVVLGLVLILIGGICHWHWVRNPWFRLAHLGTILVVVAQAWLGILCPLTTLEIWLRIKAHQTTYQESFIQYWLQRFLYYDAPLWVFALIYTLFALLVVLTWLRFPPRFKFGKIQ